ncbi:hypothetical protein NE662_09575, partial [Bifidobacterium pseudocatenulatum]|uniref:hypothetical protein n=1 Tax=Bifidobacterium pseudocatenulatum TaxID=28026 RepID=UPI00210CC7FF
TFLCESLNAFMSFSFFFSRLFQAVSLLLNYFFCAGMMRLYVSAYSLAMAFRASLEKHKCGLSRWTAGTICGADTETMVL